MAKRIEGVTEKLLECAKEEFLGKGYENASLRNIAQRAGSSKGAIYIRYPDKESLYRAIVEPAAYEFCRILERVFSGFEALPGDQQISQRNTYAAADFPSMIDFIYDHFDEFKVLLGSGENTVCQEFIHRVVELDVGCMMSYIEMTGNDALTSGRLTPELAHLLSSAFYSGLFEVVLHDMPRAAAAKYISSMSGFFNAGWKLILDGEQEGGSWAE